MHGFEDKVFKLEFFRNHGLGQNYKTIHFNVEIVEFYSIFCGRKQTVGTGKSGGGLDRTEY